MKRIKKIIYSIIVICFFCMILIKNFVYADIIAGPNEVIEYSPLYYLAIIVVIVIVVAISTSILRNIYKSNQIDREEENEKEWKNNDKS